MPRYLLDTNAVIALLNNPRSPLALKVRQRKPAEVAVSSVVIYELYFGAFKSQRAERNARIVDQIALETIEFDRDDARQAGQIRAILERLGTPIGSYDVLIAGQAKARGLVLVTHDTRELRRISDLAVEDWHDG